MTIERAINTLNSLKDYYNDKYEDGYVGFDNVDNKAIDMAVKALEIMQAIEHYYESIKGSDSEWVAIVTR